MKKSSKELGMCVRKKSRKELGNCVYYKGSKEIDQKLCRKTIVAWNISRKFARKKQSIRELSLEGKEQESKYESIKNGSKCMCKK